MRTITFYHHTEVNNANNDTVDGCMCVCVHVGVHYVHMCACVGACVLCVSVHMCAWLAA